MTTRPALAAWFAAAIAAWWAALLGVLNTAQHADSIEQYNWAHSLEWGYWKHPPLPTWLMRGAIELVGATHWTSFLLAALCLGGTALFTWRVARMLMPERVAMLALLIWPLHHGFSWRAHIYNHNTVLALTSSAMVWAALVASRSGRSRDWALAGLFVGLGFLAKYQAAVPLAAILFALWRSGAMRDSATQRGLCIAASVALAAVLPHAVWALGHDIPTLAYLQHSAPPVSLAERPLLLLRFLAAQISMTASLLVAAIAIYFWPRRNHEPAGMRADAAPSDGVWLTALVFIPLLVVAVADISGLKPQKAWGLQSLQFLALWLAWQIERRRPGFSLRVACGLTLTMAVSGAIFMVLESRDAAALAKLHTLDRVFPARQLANAAAQDWRRASACPLRFVVGPGFPAGLVSVYSGNYPAVLEDGDFAKSPWIDPAALQRDGALVVGGPTPATQVPPGASKLPVPTRPDQGPAAIWWQVKPPAQPERCRAEPN